MADRVRPGDHILGREEGGFNAQRIDQALAEHDIERLAGNDFDDPGDQVEAGVGV
jgi:hypothetical protein